MSVFRKALPFGAVILGASFGSGFIYAKQHTSAATAVINNKTTHVPPMPGVSPVESSTIPAPALRRDDLELKFVQIFFRHGARTPFGSIPNIEKVLTIYYVVLQGTALPFSSLQEMHDPIS